MARLDSIHIGKEIGNLHDILIYYLGSILCLKLLGMCQKNYVLGSCAVCIDIQKVSIVIKYHRVLSSLADNKK